MGRLEGIVAVLGIAAASAVAAGAAPAPYGGAPAGAGASLILADARACNPRVRICEEGEDGATTPRPTAPERPRRERRFWLRGTQACNPRVRICDEG